MPMPLRATVGGREVISSFLSEEEWVALKEEIKLKSLEVIIAQTHKSGFLRTSKLGLQHFAHKKGEAPENWKPETAQHLKAKNHILLACRDSSWAARSEADGNDWIADVLAEKDKAKIAFEVQWSPQTLERTKERQENYKKSGVRGCWFFKSPPRELKDWNDNLIADKDLPVFKLLESQDSELFVESGNACHPLRDFVKLLLSKKIKFCSGYTTSKFQNIEFTFWKTSCWRCRTFQNVYHASGESMSLISCCNKEISSYSSSSYEENLAFHPSIIKEALKIINSNEGKYLKLGQIKKRYSNTVKKEYMSFGCIKCDALFGNHFISEAFARIGYNRDHIVFNKLVELESSINVKNEPHWCYSESNQFC
jgi:hypothetical protein